MMPFHGPTEVRTRTLTTHLHLGCHQILAEEAQYYLKGTDRSAVLPRPLIKPSAPLASAVLYWNEGAKNQVCRTVQVAQIKECFHSDGVVTYDTNGLELMKNQEEMLKFQCFLWWKWIRNAKGKADVETRIKPKIPFLRKETIFKRPGRMTVRVAFGSQWLRWEQNDCKKQAKWKGKQLETDFCVKGSKMFFSSPCILSKC